MAGLISIGLTGLLSHQSALSTTGNNVANANTPGYSRQQAIFESLPSQYSGAGFVGTGVTIADITRLNNEFVNQQRRSDETLNGGQSVMAAELSRLDNLFGSESTGLNTVLTGFFSALQDSAESPDSLPQRQLLISRGETLAQRFHSISSRIDQQSTSIEGQLTVEVSRINSLAKNIAELNLAISSSPGQAQGLQPNELLDQRDEKLRQLAASIRIQVNPQDNGQVDVYIGNGQSLVSRDQANALSLKASSENPAQSQVFLNTGGADRRISGDVAGGRLGAMLEFRDKALVPAENALGRIAIGIASAVNEQHRMGLDLEGNQGGLFFADINSDSAKQNRVTVNSDNQGTGSLSVEIGNLADLGIDDFVLEMTSDTEYAIRRIGGGGNVVTGTLPAAPGAIAMDGFNIEIGTGSFQEGDRFRLSPAGEGARDIAVAISRPQEIALASPLSAMTGADNRGSAAIDQGTVLDIDGAGFTDGKLDTAITVEFTSATEYLIYENGTAVGAPTTFTLGTSGNLFDPADGAPDYGFQFAISGTPQAGDSFEILSNNSNSQDNRNALALGEIANGGLLDAGKATLNDAYGLLVSDIGIETSKAQRGLEASATLLEQSNNLWQAQSGVNLDEEAGKLIQYQAAYNASAQVMSVARDLFDTLLNSFR